LTYGWQRTALTFLTLGFLLSRPMVQWHAAVLSESLTLSLVILSLSFFIRFVILRGKHLFGVTSVALFSVATLNRVTLIPLFIVLSLSVVFECIRRARFGFAIGKLLLVLSLLAYIVSSNQAMDESWSANGGLAKSSFMFAYMTADFGSFADEMVGSKFADQLRQGIRSGASDGLFEAFSSDPDVPSCLKSVRSDPSCPYCHGQVIVEQCARDVSWLNNNFSAWYARFLLSHPTRTLKLSALALAEGAQFAQYAFPWSPVPPVLEKVFTGFAFPFPFPALAFWVLVVPVHHAWSRRKRANNEWSGKPDVRRSLWTMLAVLLGSLSAVILPALMIGVDIQRLASAGVASCYLTLLAILGLSHSPREKEQVAAASQGTGEAHPSH